MAEIYSFFDPVEIEPGVFDREYNAQEFTDYFGDIITTGVMKGKFAELKVTANGSNMIAEIDTGVAFVEGRRYANTTPLGHTHDTESLGVNRIDRIVVRLDRNTDKRHVKSFIKKGVPSANPVPPALTRNELVYEISLAQVPIVGGQTYINAEDIIDEREDENVCGWAGSNILPNFDDAALSDLVNDVDSLNSKIDLKANKEQESWITATISQNHTNDVNHPLRYYKDEFGIVHLRGIVHIGTAYNRSQICRMPVGYRPPRDFYFSVFLTNLNFNMRFSYENEFGVEFSGVPINLDTNKINSIHVNISYRPEG